MLKEISSSKELLLRKNKLKYFSSDYCAGNTCHFGRCVFDFKQKKYGCKCFDHYGGSMCQKGKILSLLNVCHCFINSKEINDNFVLSFVFS